MGQTARQTIVAGYRWEQTTQTARQLYETAIKRFQLRLPAAVVPRLPARQDFPAPRQIDELSAVPPNLKSWVRALEHIAFMRDLHAMGASKAASRLAARALCARPWDRQIWWAAAPHSPLSKLYFAVRMLYRSLKASS
jgi:hypothetical protein